MSNNSFVHRRSRDPMEIPGLLAVLQSLDHGLRRSVRSQSHVACLAYASKGVHNDWQHHAHPQRLALRDGGFGLLNPCRLRRRRRKCGTHRRRPGAADCTVPNSNSDPAAPVHSDARALQSHAEPNVRHTRLGLLARRIHAISDPISLERRDRQIRGAPTRVRRLEPPRGPAGSSIWGHAT
jgi:hypothetical protein